MRGIVGALTALPRRAAGSVVYLPLRPFLGGRGLVTAEVVPPAVEFCHWSWEAGGLGDLRGGFHTRSPSGAARLSLHPEAGVGAQAPAPSAHPPSHPCPFGLLRARCSRASPGLALSGHRAVGTGKPTAALAIGV